MLKTLFKQAVKITLVAICAISSALCLAHDNHINSATYLGNEGVMIKSVQHKILFDPFFHNNFSIYQLVPDDIRIAIFNGRAPYDEIDMVFISHAHDDHFSASDMLAFLEKQPQVHVVAPEQAIAKLTLLTASKHVLARMHAVSLQYGDKPWQETINNIEISAVCIPHAGWPARATVENIVFRVTLPDGVTVMHMGDADANDDHFLPQQVHWQQKVTNTAFPPYWFFYSAEGRDILEHTINAKQHIGVHVPIKVPKQLNASGKMFYSTPGQITALDKH